MKLDNLLKLVKDNPVFNSEILRVGKKSLASVSVQLSRWKKAGKIIQLRRGIYMINPTYIKLPFDYDLYISGFLHNPSYLSLEKALEYYGLIPEGVSVYTSVTTKRPIVLKTPIGEYSYRHIKPDLFWGYKKLETGLGDIFIAFAEKAILDMFYLYSVNINKDWLDELRLQNFENLDLNKLMSFAEKFKSLSIKKSAKLLIEYIKAQKNREKYL